MSQHDEHDTINILQQFMGSGSSRLYGVVPNALKKVIKNREWETRTNKKGELFQTFEEFVVYPLWWGLESSIEDLIGFCKKRPDVQQLIREQVGAAGAHGTNRFQSRPDIIRSISQPSGFGDSPTYILRRLKRDRPDLAEQVVAGALSAHAAAVQAGFRRATWSAPADPEALAKAIERRYPGLKLVRAGAAS